MASRIGRFTGVPCCDCRPEGLAAVPAGDLGVADSTWFSPVRLNRPVRGNGLAAHHGRVVRFHRPPWGLTLPLHARSDTVVRAYDGPTRGRAPVADGASGEGVVAPRLCPRPHLQGRTATGGSMPRTLTSALPHATPGSEVLLQGWV